MRSIFLAGTVSKDCQNLWMVYAKNLVIIGAIGIEDYIEKPLYSRDFSTAFFNGLLTRKTRRALRATVSIGLTRPSF